MSNLYVIYIYLEFKCYQVTEGVKKSSIFGSGRARDEADPNLKKRMDEIEQKTKERLTSVTSDE